MFRFYVEVARTAYRRQLIYRWANLAGIITNVFFGIILSSIMIALYRARPVTDGYSLSDALSYIWVSQALIMVVLPFGWIDLMLTIRTGEVVMDLHKPCNFFVYWCSRELGRSVYYFLFRALPLYAIGWLIFHLEVSTDWRVYLAFLGCLTLGTTAGVIFRVLLNLFAFWMLEARSMIVLGTTIAQFFSGTYLPVAFLPSWLALLNNWLPFSGMMNMPNQIFLGKVNGTALVSTLALQVFWVLVLGLLVYLITTVATRRVVIQGG
jgi:ABC-2 type transport system permease protein